MLRFHILNVGQGDSIVVEHESSEGRFFGVIDSNRNNRYEPRALEKLKELGAESLSFVCLTHPHHDHYSGLSDILETFSGNIDQFIIFPAGDFVGSKIKRLAKNYKKIQEQQDDPIITRDAREFVSILMLLDRVIGLENTRQVNGPHNIVPLSGFQDVEVICALPFLRFKGEYLDRVKSGDPSIFSSEKENELSLALSFEYRGVSVMLGGDATHANWLRRRGDEEVRGLNKVGGIAVKLPHHGSKYDCKDEMFEVAFLPQGASGGDERYAFISANGSKHPDQEVLHELKDRDIKPYCTNLHSFCGANAQNLLNTRGVDPVLGKYLSQLSTDAVTQTCQGDITFTINDDGTYALDRETRVPCGFRGELSFLSWGT